MRSARFALALALLAASSSTGLLGCEERTSPLPGPASSAGTRGGPCYGNGTCNAGLVCEDAVCADAPAGVPDAGGVDDGGLVAEADGGLPPDSGLPPVEAGTVFGVLELEGETEHGGVVVTIAGRMATTGAGGEYRVEQVPVGSHVLEAVPPRRTGLGRVAGSVRLGDGSAVPDGVQVSLQVAPRTNEDGRVVGVVVFAGRDTEVPRLTLARPGPRRLHAIADARGQFTFAAVPAGDYSGAYPEQPDPRTGRYTQAVGTFSLTAATAELASERGSDAPINPTGEPIGDLRWSTHANLPGAGTDPAVALGRTLAVRADNTSMLDPISLYRYAYLFTEDGILGSSGLDLERPAPVAASDASADLYLTGVPGNGSLYGVDVEAGSGVLLTGDARMDALRTTPTSGLTTTARLSFDYLEPWWLGRQPAGERVLVVRSAGGTSYKIKALLSANGGGTQPGQTQLGLTFLVLPASRTGAFTD